MPRYLCIQRSQPGNREKPSPAQMEQMYAEFNAWREKFQQNIVDLGGRLGEGKLITADSAADGPFVEAKELIGGYMVLSAETLEAAIEVARRCPGLVGPGSGVEVRKITTP